jgi:hypothetical protein
VILQPPLPSVEELLADEAAAAGDKAKKGGKPTAAAAAKKPAGKDAKGGGKSQQAQSVVQHCLDRSPHGYHTILHIMWPCQCTYHNLPHNLPQITYDCWLQVMQLRKAAAPVR